MQVIKLGQQNDREAWLEFRLGKITGTKAKIVKPLMRGADRTPQGFWQLLAERLCVQPDGEPVMDRGQRLENEALQALASKLNLDIDLDPGIWVSDLNEAIAYSPDGAEKKDIPTWAAEAKCLSSANHLKYVIKDRIAKKGENYTPIDSIPNDSKNAYKEQVVQAFVVNDQLETLYFVLHDDRVAIDHLVTHVIEIKRQDIAGFIEDQTKQQTDVLQQVNELIESLVKEG